MSPLIPPGVLLQAYREGVFPMATGTSRIEWFFPERRGVLPLDPPRFSHGVRRALRERAWEHRVDSAFRRVMLFCAERPDTWIDECILDSYCELHRLGHAHSVEVWLGDDLAGGLYGVHLGGAFFGESMFSRVSGASKAALAGLMIALRNAGFLLLDTQWTTGHLAQFGAIEIPASDYLRRLDAALALSIPFPNQISLRDIPAVL